MSDLPPGSTEGHAGARLLPDSASVPAEPLTSLAFCMRFK